MKLKIVQIVDRGKPFYERLHISVLAQSNLNFYAVFDTVRVEQNSIVSTPRMTYWFPTVLVNPGDAVFLFTGPGKNSTERRRDGGTNHYFYWAQPKTIWDNPSSCAVLLEIVDWETSP